MRFIAQHSIEQNRGVPFRGEGQHHSFVDHELTALLKYVQVRIHAQAEEGDAHLGQSHFSGAVHG